MQIPPTSRPINPNKLSSAYSIQLFENSGKANPADPKILIRGCLKLIYETLVLATVPKKHALWTVL